ncbi:MAG: hypothetical protein ACF8TS_04935 [Maioricimonas sp. JB049]
MRRVWVAQGRLVAVVGAVWLAVCGPAWWLAGQAGVEGSLYAALACLVPGLVVVAAVERAAPESRAVVGLAVGLVLRLAAAVTAAVVIASWRDDLRLAEFFGWLVLFYLVALAAETSLVLSDGVPGRSRESR